MTLTMASATACGGSATSPEEATGAEGEAIINGSAVTAATQQRLGLVYVTGSGSVPNCSGVLLANDWVMTAGHCVSTFGQGAGTTSSMATSMSASIVETSGSPSQSQSDAVYMFGNVEIGYAPDIAVFHLQHPLLVNGSTSGFSTTIDSTASASVPIGTGLTEYGRGCSGLQVGLTAPPTCNNTWLQATLGVNSKSFGSLTFEPNIFGQIAASGDSGGPYFRNFNGAQRLSAIQSSAVWNCATGTGCPASNAISITQATAVDLGDWNGWIGAVFQSTWNSALPVALFDVFSGEIAGLSNDASRATQAFSDVNVVSWWAAANVAEYLCFNRGFGPTGHFNGQQSAPRYGLLCEGAGSSARDSTLAQVNATPEPFTDITRIGWAQANRVAGDICHDQLGFVGGYFDGFQDVGQGLYGLTCSQSHAVYFLATSSQLAATGWPVGEVNTVAWGQANRAASSYCIGQGYAGGYLNGQEDHTALTYGVICEE